MEGFAGKVALVTGASRRIGSAIAIALGQHGATVIVNYLKRKELAEQVAKRIRTVGGHAFPFMADVRNREAVRDMTAKAVERFGGLDILINNARHLSPIRSFFELEWERDMVSQLEVHLGGAFNCCKEAVPHMINRGGGCIINMLSMAIRTANPRSHSYGPAKAALRNFTMNLAVELGPLGIRVNSISPGTTETPEFPARYTSIERQRLLEGTPLGRMATPEEIADAVVFFCSDSARFITGTDLLVNGGRLIVP